MRICRQTTFSSIAPIPQKLPASKNPDHGTILKVRVGRWRLRNKAEVEVGSSIRRCGNGQNRGSGASPLRCGSRIIVVVVGVRRAANNSHIGVRRAVKMRGANARFLQHARLMKRRELPLRRRLWHRRGPPLKHIFNRSAHSTWPDVGNGHWQWAVGNRQPASSSALSSSLSSPVSELR